MVSPFRIPCQSPRSPFMADNLHSFKGVEKGDANSGAFGRQGLEPLNLMSLHLVWCLRKSPGNTNLFTIIPYPRGNSVKNVTPDKLCSVRYTSFDQIGGMTHHFGVGAEMSKCNIKSAFHLLPVTLRTLSC